MLSRKPEPSLHLLARKMESKAPHLSPVPHAGVVGVLPMWAAGTNPGSLQPPSPWFRAPQPPVPRPGLHGPCSQRAREQLPRAHVSSQHSCRSSSNPSDLGRWMAANCHHCILSRPCCKATAALALRGLKAERKKKKKKKKVAWPV